MATKNEVIEMVKDWGCEQEFSVVPVIKYLEKEYLPTYGDTEYCIMFLKPDAPGLEIESDRLKMTVGEGVEDFVLGTDEFFCLWNKETKCISFHNEDVSESEVIMIWVC